MKPRTGDKFRSLWVGNWNDHYNSASEADSSVVFTLAYYTKDPTQIDRIFRQSKLMRSKWDQLHGSETYGATTIAKALCKVTKRYTPKPKRTAARRPLPPEPSNAGLPSIIIDDRQLGDLTSQAMAVIKRANSPPSTFVRSGGLVRIGYDEQDIPKIEPLDGSAICLRWSRRRSR
jgi:putative DNA primase/helicase